MNVFKQLMQCSVAPLLALAVALAMLTHAPWARAEVVYGVNDNGIYSVDSITGGPATQLVVFSPAKPADNAVTLAVRPSDGMLFYLDSTSVNPNLWRWDPSIPTVAPVLVGTPGAATINVIRLAFDLLGDLYAMNFGAPASIWKLNPATGGILSVTPASGYNGGTLPNGGDICRHPTTGVLYMILATQLYTLTTSGVVTQLGTVSGLTASSRGCAFDRNGQLFVSQDTTINRVDIGTLMSTAMVNIGIRFGDLATNPDPNIMADLRATKTASNATPGNTVSFTLTVTNDGPSRATDVRLLDLLPVGLTFVSATPSQGTYSTTADAAQPLAYPAGTWRVGTLNNGATATLTINASVTGTTPITNWAQVSYADQYDPDSTPGSVVPPAVAQDDQASVTITPSPDLGAVKTAASSFAVGTPATYSIAVNNTLGSLTTGANTYTVTDLLPTGLTFVSAVGAGWTCALNTPAAGDNVVGGSRMVCTNSAPMTAGAGNANAITLTVLPAAAAAPSVSNTATVSGGGEPVSNNGNNSSTISTTVCIAGGCPDLILAKTSVSTFSVGSNAVYTLTVSNIGGLITSANITVTDTLPAGLTFVSGTGTGWNACTAAGQVVTCTRPALNTIAPGSPGSPTAAPSITLTVAVTAPAAPSVTNSAIVSGGGEPLPQGNNSASLTSPVRSFDLTITKTKTAATNFALNIDTDTYTLTVNNIGLLPTTNTYTVTDTLPAGLTLNTVPAATGWTCTANVPLAGDNIVGGGRVYCTRATVILASSAAASTIVFQVRVRAAAAPSVTNTTSISNPDEPTNLLANNTSTAITPVNAPDLFVTKSHNGNFTVGVNGVYTLTVSNIGALTTSTANVVVTDTLPAGLTFVSGAGTGWTACTAAGQVVTCVRPLANAIAANSSAPPITLTVSVGAAAATASPVTNNVSVAGGNEPAGNNGNNSAADITFVYYSPVITKTFVPASVVAGVPSTLTLTISNPAGNPVSLAGLAVVDPFPAGMAIAATPAFSNSCGGTVSPGSAQGDTLLSLTGGATGAAGTSCAIQVNVTSTTVGANVNTTGQVSSSNSGTGATASATLTVTAPAAPTLTMVSSPDPVGVNMPVTLTYTINNSTVANTNLGFIHNFPIVGGAQMVWQSTVSSTCTAGSATVTNPAGTALVAGTSTGIRLFGGYDPAANAVCTIVVTATVGAAGTVTTINGTPGISGLTGTALLVSTVNDTFNVRAVTLTKIFSPASVPTNSVSALTFSLTNGLGNPAQGGTTPINNLMAFTEALPAGVVVASAPNATQCNGTVAATVGSGTITFSGGTLSLGQTSCTISVNVTSAAAAVYNNTPANVTGVTTSIINSATATLTVTGPPSLVFMKTVSVTSDPVNGVTNPKNIPGSEVLYTLRVTNTGTGTVDNNSLFISDPIPTNTELFVGDLSGAGSGPILFVQGSPTSNITWTFAALNSLTDDVDFSSDGGVTWTFVPTPPYDPAVNRIRLNPKGMMAGSGGGSPYFDLRFRVRLK